jgi:hypothetical protein
MVIGTRKLLLYEDGQREAFDLAADPSELHDLSAQGDVRLQTMASILRMTIEGWRRAARDLQPHGEPDRTRIERLRALGYVR